MSVAKKRPYLNTETPGSARGNFASGKQLQLRVDKATAEQLSDKLQSRILENPTAQKKAALLISLWIAGKTSPKTKK